jgi:hypothetical protein
MGEVRRIMGDAILIQQIQEPPMRYILCRGSDLGDVTTKTRALGNLLGVESVTVSLNRELLVSTEFEHALVRERIRDLQGARQ